MIVRNLWLLVVLPTLVLLAITETSGWSQSIDQDEHNALKTFARAKRIKPKEFPDEKNSVEDLRGEKKSPIKVTQWESNNLHDSERIKVYERNAEDGGRFKRNATELDELKGSKKSYTKLKLAQTQSALKNWKNKNERTTRKRIDRRQANYHVTGTDRANTGRSKRSAEAGNQGNDKSDYYAQRKAVMDRFYARQKEIAEKYASRSSTTPKYIYTYDVEAKTDLNDASLSNKVEDTTEETDGNSNLTASTSATTTILEPVTETTIKIYPKQVQPVENSSEVNNEEDLSDDYDDYVLNDSRPSSDTNFEDTANGALNDGEWTMDDQRNDTLKWGNCAGKLVYQHNLILNVYNSSSLEVDLTASLEGPFCITCIRVIATGPKSVTVSLNVNRKEDGTFSHAKLTLKGYHQELLSYVIKIWAVDKVGDRCDKVTP